ncbi:hypothetical protein [Streptomyces sp. WAC08241]|uniref:hypothetical protein n=1 Tax=Streptomyces sp. WAC08241 TaxID=2487421 RepID=UPI000F790632|nr:hypothetical protein [Streptomyces sp. WAC08241]RSS35427.1 hypothetical protein EF906_27495 [Streptomyces sp. WAC08241]
MNTGAKIAAFAAALAATFGAAYGVGAAVGPSAKPPAVEEHADPHGTAPHEEGSHGEGSRQGRSGPNASLTVRVDGSGAHVSADGEAEHDAGGREHG